MLDPLLETFGVQKVANTAQSKKRARQNETHREHNASQRSMMRTYVKKLLTVIGTGNKTQANEEFRTVTSVLDKMVTKGIIQKNKAARHKSRLNAKIKALA